jgi:putative ABC transport system permease protein
VVGQFAISIGLIVCTAIIYSQTLFARTVDPGYERDGLLQVGNLGFRGVDNRDGQVTEQIRRLPGVVSAARTQIAVAPGNNQVTRVYSSGSVEPVEIGVYAVEAQFLRTMGMRFVAGRISRSPKAKTTLPRRTPPAPNISRPREF